MLTMLGTLEVSSLARAFAPRQSRCLAALWPQVEQVHVGVTR
jgi:hypothetical protein